MITPADEEVKDKVADTASSLKLEADCRRYWLPTSSPPLRVPEPEILHTTRKKGRVSLCLGSRRKNNENRACGRPKSAVCGPTLARCLFLQASELDSLAPIQRNWRHCPAARTKSSVLCSPTPHGNYAGLAVFRQFPWTLRSYSLLSQTAWRREVNANSRHRLLSRKCILLLESELDSLSPIQRNWRDCPARK